MKNTQRNENDYFIKQPLNPTQIMSEHCCHKPINKEINIDQEYADDMSSITTNPNIIEYKKKYLPAKLRTRNLEINETKTEEYEIRRKENIEWKDCKFLGSLLNKEEDIIRRKKLSIAAINKMKYILYGKVDIKIKIRAFNCYVSSIFLYNRELWSITSTIAKSINAFHRRLLRTLCLNIHWLRTISNEIYMKLRMKCRGVYPSKNCN